MRLMAAYDMMEAARNASAWMGATARTMGSFPATAMIPNPAFSLLAAWGAGHRAKLRAHGGQARLGDPAARVP